MGKFSEQFFPEYSKNLVTIRKNFKEMKKN